MTLLPSSEPHCTLTAMTQEDIEAVYLLAIAAHASVAPAQKTFHDATGVRRDLVRRLRDEFGQSDATIATRLGVNKTRISQLIGPRG